MKKRILSIALIAMSLVSFTGFAQNAANNTEEIQKENVMGIKGDKKDGRPDKKRSDKKGKGKMDRGDRKGGRMEKMRKGDPFADMNLSDSQRQQLNQLNSERKAAREQKMAARKETKQRNDSARMAERRADKKDYLNKVKAIVGPEQYVVFLENVYVNGNGGNQHKAMMKKGHRDGKKDFANHRDGKKEDRAKKYTKKS